MATTYDFIAANKRRSVLLTAAFVLIVLFLGWAIDQYQGGGNSFLAIAVIVSLIMTLTGYFSGDKIALAVSRARPVTKDQAPYVCRMIENLAIANGLPMPKVYVMEDPSINAFATGRDPKHASVAVTTGAVEKLENEELEGVLAHELSHIKNYDVRFMTLVMVLAGVIVLMADFFWRSQWFGGGRRSDDRKSGNILMLIGLVLIIFAPLIGELIKLAVSRRREYLADASGALLTRYPEGLARALEKIRDTNTRPLQGASDATAHLFFSNPFGPAAKGLHGLFLTHPPIEKRVEALRSMASNT